jgi:hypothetical protein
VRDFIVKNDTNATLEGVLFADGTVVLHYMPPIRATVILPSWDEAVTLFDEGEQIVWVNDHTRGYEVA